MGKQKSFSYLHEFDEGIIGPRVWEHLIREVNFSEKDVMVFLKSIPPTEELRNLKKEGEVVVCIPESIHGCNISVNFWEKFGFGFIHNSGIAKFSWDEYATQKLCSGGIYVGNPRGIAEGKELAEQIHLLPDGYTMATPGVQMSIDIIHFLMGRGFINIDRTVRCACDTLGVASIGGGNNATKTLRVYKDSYRPNNMASLSCFKKVLI